MAPRFTVMLEDPSRWDQRIRGVLRAGAICVLVFQSVYLLQKLGSAEAEQVLPFHLFNLGIGLVLLAFAFSPWVARWWRSFIVVVCGAMMASTSAISVLSGRFEPLFVTVLALVLAGGFLPWGEWEQAATGVLATACYLVPTLIHPGHDPAAAIHWLGLFVGVGLGQTNVFLRTRNREKLHETREALRAQVDALRESEQKFRSVFEASLDPIAISDLHDGKIVEVNEEFVRRTGFSREMTTGRTTVELGMWADPDARQMLLEPLLTQGYLRDLEVPQRSRDGRESTTAISSVVVQMGGRQRVITVMRDVTQIRKAERELRASEKKFREIFDSSLDHTVILSLADGRFIDVNQEFTRSLGYPREEAIGKTTAELGVWTQRELKREVDEQLRRQGFYRGVEVELRARDGRVIQGLSSAVVTRIGDEDCVVAVTRDISHLKEADRKLRASQETLRKIFDATPDIITVYRFADGTCVDFNHEALRLGFTSEELLGSESAQREVWANEEERNEFRERILSAGEVRNMEARLRYKDGRTFPALVSAAKVDLNSEPCVLTMVRDISERHEAERRLRDSEAALRRIFDASLDEISVIDVESQRVLDVNPEFLRAMELSRSQAVGRPVRELFDWTDSERRREMLKLMREHGVVRNFEAPLRRPDGRQRDILISMVRTYLGGRLCAICFARDVSEIKAADQALRDSEEKFRSIFESNLDIVLVADMETGKIVEVNEEFVRRTGFSRAEAIGNTTDELGTWAESERRSQLVDELNRRGYAQGIEATLRTRTGASIETLVSSVVIRLGGRQCVLSVARDISDLKAVESALRESEQKFRKIFEKALDMVVLTSLTTGTVIEVNEEFVKHSGYTREEAIGKSNAELNLWIDFDARDRFFAELVEKGYVRSLESEMRVKDGSTHPVLVSSVAVRLGQQDCTVTVMRDISRLKEAERELRDSEATLRQIFDASTDSISLVDLETMQFIDVNAAFQKFSGVTHENIIGRPAEDFDFWDPPERRREFYRLLNETGRVHNMEVDFKVKSGERFPCLISAVTVPIRGRRCVLSMARDVSDRKEAERRLRESEATFRKLFEANVDPMALTDITTGCFIDVNQAFLKARGFTREEVVGRPYRELDLWADQSQQNEYARELATRGESREKEISLKRKDGSVFPALLSAVILEVGGRLCSLTVSRDISERKEAERKLRQSEETLRRIFNSSLDPMTLNHAEDGRYVEVNEAFLRMSGLTREQVIGHTFHELGMWPNPEEWKTYDRLLRKSGKARNIEASFPMANGTLMPALISGVVVEIGGRLCCLSIVRDITQIKESQRELEAAREAALAASNAKSEFLSSMSHEIRTPMNAILGMADLLWETELNTEQRRYLDTVISNGNALLDLINSILDLAKVESGRLNLEAVEFDAGELTEKVAETLAVRAHEKGVELAVRLAPDLPPVVVGDPLRLRQVLTNLVGNAIKFTEQGEVVIAVEREAADASGTALRFCVADTGVGIPADKLTGIFSPFTQADSSTTRRYGGSGLGLTIVDRLVRLMGGRVWTESTPGKGSVFQFVARFAEPADAVKSTDRAYPELRGARILVVDDSATTRAIMCETLSPLGATVAGAESAAEGLEAIERARGARQPFDAVFIDCRMPGTGGSQMVLRMREANHRPPVIMMPESVALAATLVRMKELGLERYVLKPIKRRELCAAAAFAVRGMPAVETTAQARESQPELEIMQRPLRILLADDSPDNRALIKAYLRKAPYMLEEAENGSLALEKFKREPFDLVLMDIQMPVLDGYTTVRMIRQWEQDNARLPTPIIALTASALEDAVRRAIEAGCNLHVAKPVKRATLFASIAQAIGADTAENGANDGPTTNRNGAHPKLQVEIDADIEDLIPGFLERKRQDSTRITEALDNGDLEEGARLAHRLKGEGGSYGFDGMSEIGAALEAAAKGGDREAARRCALELRAYLENVEVIFQESPA